MSCCPRLAKFLKVFDLFPNSKFLRYNGQPEYTTAAGGFISIAVIVIFVILFASMGIRTANREIIFTTTNTQFQDDPSSLKFTTSNAGNFMFGVSIFGLNLSATTNRLFNVKMYQQYFSPVMNSINSTEIPLVQCTEQHLNFNPQIKKMYYTLGFSAILCPPIGQQFHITGKYISDIYSQISIFVSRCNSTTDPTCASDSYFTTVQKNVGNIFRLNLPFVNSLINHGIKDYKNFYLEDSNGILFSSLSGAVADILINQDTIQTDISIMPYEDIQTQKVVRVPKKMGIQSFVPTATSPLIQVTLKKSAKAVVYTRSFNKIDAYFSYVGGLIGTIIGFMFIIEKYNEKAFQISIGHKLFKDDDGQDIPSSSFHIGYFCLVVIKSILNWFKCSLEWKTTQTYIDTCQETSNQLDITYIMRKLIFLDTAMAKILEHHQIQALCLRQKPTIEKVKQSRKMHFSNEIIKNQLTMPGQNGETRLNINQSNNVSQQQILMREEMRQIDQIKQDQIHDASQMDLSVEQDDIRHMQTSVRKVVAESREGKAISQRILEQIDEDMFKKMGVRLESSVKECSDNNQIRIMPREEAQSKSNRGAKKEKGDDFDYNFENIQKRSIQ